MDLLLRVEPGTSQPLAVTKIKRGILRAMLSAEDADSARPRESPYSA